MENQITVRGLDPETEKRLRELARRRQISLNKAAKLLMRKGAGLQEDNSGPEVVGNALDSFIGSWTRRDETEFLDSIRAVEQIDADFWQ